MKKLLSILSLSTFLSFTAAAQGQGNVYVHNNTPCEVCLTVFAACPNGTSYSTQNSICVSGGTSSQLYSVAGGWLNGNAWGPSAPACRSWQWQFALVNMPNTTYLPGSVPAPFPTVLVGDEGTTYPYTGNGTIYYEQTVEQVETTCSGPNGFITVKWIVDTSGNIIVEVDPA